MQTIHGANQAADRIRVLVAHPNALVSAGLEAVLSREPDVEVIRGDDSRSALSREQMESASIMITECDTALAVAPVRPESCRVLILTADESEVSIRRAMERGASGYLLFAASRENVLQAIRRVHDGKTEFDPVVSSKIIESLTAPALTSRQLEVLSLLMIGYSDKEIARTLVRSVETAKSHVKAILIKLGVSSRTEAVAVARRRGLVPSDGLSDPAKTFSRGEGGSAPVSPSTLTAAGNSQPAGSVRVCPTPSFSSARSLPRRMGLTSFGAASSGSPGGSAKCYR